MGRLVLFAYPGPTSELRDQLAVEAFIDSLDDPSLDVRLRNHFPENLTSASQTALRLEANQGDRSA